MPEMEDDRATPAPTDDALPLAPLAAYLFDALPDLRANFDEEIIVARLGQGYSNLTYLIEVGTRELDADAPPLAGSGRHHELVLRRPPLGAQIATAHDMGREVKVLTGLARVYDRVPRVLLHCEDAEVIGAPFYVMERLRGVVLHADDPHRPPIAPAVMTQLANNVIDNLAAIHALDYHAAGLTDLGRPAGYVTRQIRGWTKRYHAAQTDDVPDLERALHWLAAHEPAKSGAALIHNDYKYDNLILDATDLSQIVAVLDWEMCTLGDPLLDLGTTLGYWMEPNDPPALVEMFGLTTLPGNPDRAAVVERYCAASECADFDPLYYYVYGLTKIGVILQQIYHRYHQGMSQDARFARLGKTVAACGLMAVTAMDKGRISGLF